MPYNHLSSDGVQDFTAIVTGLRSTSTVTHEAFHDDCIACRIARQVPSSMVVLDMPDAAAAAGEDDDDDDDVYEPSEAVEDRSIIVDGIANAARL